MSVIDFTGLEQLYEPMHTNDSNLANSNLIVKIKLSSELPIIKLFPREIANGIICAHPSHPPPFAPSSSPLPRQYFHRHPPPYFSSFFPPIPNHPPAVFAPFATPPASPLPAPFTPSTAPCPYPPSGPWLSIGRPLSSLPPLSALLMPSLDTASPTGWSKPPLPTCPAARLLTPSWRLSTWETPVTFDLSSCSTLSSAQVNTLSRNKGGRYKELRGLDGCEGTGETYVSLRRRPCYPL